MHIHALMYNPLRRTFGGMLFTTVWCASYRMRSTYSHPIKAIRRNGCFVGRRRLRQIEMLTVSKRDEQKQTHFDSQHPDN
jgi:hypothetical protein